MIDLTQFFNLSYLFDRRPEPESSLVFLLAIVFAVAIIASGFGWLWLTRQGGASPALKQFRDRLAKFLFTFGFVGLMLVFFRWQGIPQLGMRVWLLLWLLISLGWAATVLVFGLKKLPEQRRLELAQRLHERYLPRPKADRRSLKNSI